MKKYTSCYDHVMLNSVVSFNATVKTNLKSHLLAGSENF